LLLGPTVGNASKSISNAEHTHSDKTNARKGAGAMLYNVNDA